MRFDVRYRCRFAYERPVSESQNELRACPASNDRQQLLHYRVTTAPSARMHSYQDYWGTRVDTFGIRAPHDSLEIVAECTVETSPQPMVAASPRLAEIWDEGFRERHHEYLGRSAHVDWDERVAAEAAKRAELAGDDLVGAVLSIHRYVGTTMQYVTGSTYVGVDVTEVFDRREGVCQDFAHLMLAMCRSIGVPARYVSGYLFASSDSTGDEPDEDEIDVETHAWVEVAIPEGGWLGLDPTNRQQVGARHIEIGRGRDYDDVAPLRGAFIGGGASDLEVGVHMRRMAAQQQQQQ